MTPTTSTSAIGSRRFTSSIDAWPRPSTRWHAARRRHPRSAPGDHGSLFVRGLALAHLDATLGRRTEAARFLRDDVERAFAAKGIPVESVRAELCNQIDTPRTDG